jgi:hypothetical protein
MLSHSHSWKSIQLNKFFDLMFRWLDLSLWISLRTLFRALLVYSLMMLVWILFFFLPFVHSINFLQWQSVWSLLILHLMLLVPEEKVAVGHTMVSTVMGKSLSLFYSKIFCSELTIDCWCCIFWYLSNGEYNCKCRWCSIHPKGTSWRSWSLLFSILYLFIWNNR